MRDRAVPILVPTQLVMQTVALIGSYLLVAAKCGASLWTQESWNLFTLSKINTYLLWRGATF
jgi:hypothetical protein